jgi:hypothetical protein
MKKNCLILFFLFPYLSFAQIKYVDSRALYQAGLNFIKKGNKDKGQQMCDRAININPSLASLRHEKKMPGM